MRICFFLLAHLWMAATLAAQTLASPDGRYVFSLQGLTYSVSYKGQTIVAQSRLGVDVDNRLSESSLGVPRGEHENWSGHLRLKGEERTSVDTTWTPLYGENATIRDRYNQLVLHYEKGTQEGAATGVYDKRMFYAMDIVVRAYNEGIAFRYHFPETTNSLFIHITGEQTSFRMPQGTKAWYEEWAQGPYEVRSLQRKGGDGQNGDWLESERPLLMSLPPTQQGKGSLYVALMEAAMKDYVRGKFALAGDDELRVDLYGSADIIPPYDTPWRVIMAAERAVDLINHKDLILNLNAPAIDADFGFVAPGKAFRCCRLDKANIFKSIDFCKAAGMEYVELDAGWYGPEGKISSDARQVAQTRDFTMEEVCAYAKEKGVGVWLYVNQRALLRQLDELLPLYSRWGIRGIKFGFVQVGNQRWSTWLHQAVEQCAKYRIMVDIHDEYRPTGLSRTYPNLLTQEGVGGNEEMPDATHNVTLPFTRFLCGPADYTPCYFNNRVKNTRGHQLAMAAVYYSPLQFLFWYDNPFPQGWDSEELLFWRNCPTVFDQSIALDGRPGEFIVQARRAGQDWYVGAMTNTEGRTVSIPTDFLPQGKYKVSIYNDDPQSGKPHKVSTEHRQIKAGKPITLRLQASGGAALHIQPLKP